MLSDPRTERPAPSCLTAVWNAEYTDLLEVVRRTVAARGKVGRVERRWQGETLVSGHRGTLRNK